jgi:AraC family transcriptional regulator
VEPLPSGHRGEEQYRDDLHDGDGSDESWQRLLVERAVPGSWTRRSGSGSSRRGSGAEGGRPPGPAHVEAYELGLARGVVDRHDDPAGGGHEHRVVVDAHTERARRAAVHALVRAGQRHPTSIGVEADERVVDVGGDIEIPGMSAPWEHYAHAAARVLQLRLVRRGSSYLTLDLGAGARRVYTRPGDLLLSLPHSPTSFDLDAPRHLTVVCVTADHAERLMTLVGGDTVGDLAPLMAGPFRNTLVAELCRRLEGPYEYTSAPLDAALTLLIATLLDQSRNAQTRPRAARLTGATLQLVLDHVERNIADSLAVDDLAALTALSRRPFAAEFKLATGMPVHQYVLCRRVDRAVDLLTRTERPLAEIAAETGFTHQAHVTRVLRRLTGATPARHRADAT